MVSTYFQYNFVTRDMKASLARTAGDTLVARDTAYYKENIGKVKTVDQFVDDYRLFSYAMKAYGLEDMTYAKAFMKKVLESDLDDKNSYANKLTDTRYRNFAMAFGFSKSTTVAQSNAQEDAIIGLYNQTVADLDGVMKADANYFDAMTTRVTSVDQFLHDDRLRNYTFTVFGINEDTYVYKDVRGAIGSDLNDPNSYFNQNWQPHIDAFQTLGPSLQTEYDNRSERLSLIQQIDQLNTAKAQPGADQAAIQAKIDTAQARVDTLNQSLPAYVDKASETQKINEVGTQFSTLQARAKLADGYKDLASFFKFNADGSVTPGNSIMTDENKANMREAYYANAKRVTPGAAMINKANYERDIQNVTTVKDILTNTRLFNYIVLSYGLPASTLTSTLENILTDDPTNPNGYIQKSKSDLVSVYSQIAKDFNFDADGNLKSGMPPQTAAQMKSTSNGYMVHYNDKDDAADATLIAAYKKNIGTITNVDKFLADANLKKLALTAVGLDKENLTTRQLKQILTSDLNDPKSFANAAKDERYVKLAKAFNFKADGSLGSPILAQSETEILLVSKNYVLRKSQFGTADDKTKAEADATYYSDNIAKVEKLDDLLKDKKLTGFVLQAYGLDPEKYDAEELRKIFGSDLSDKNSYVNTLEETKFRDIVASFNFNAKGQVERQTEAQIQTRHGLMQTETMYYNQSLEETQGEDNAGVRLALYFRRMADTIGSAYDILADPALSEVVRTAFDIPQEMQAADIDIQKAYIDKVLKIKDLRDPDKLNKFLTRFTALYDAANNTDVAPAALLLGGSGGSSGGISADTLMTLTQLRTGGF
ncbi:hypothetical protein BJF92_03560 [Rhizobium rhizosphaerae]|uniref:Flagellar protein n=1 Tax=Xaviernesmea rhizosphaerae TaxID=1672749 RepID=A0A1Q9AH07_9HYPH|nr:DUF1217 domain-containing protein [Xaviernesmea rhizosphaerae]OLP54496.1 hypothetical protein BJF92_03560 [Xaviernesmea rhizosphaerae]